METHLRKEDIKVAVVLKEQFNSNSYKDNAYSLTDRLLIIIA